MAYPRGAIHQPRVAIIIAHQRSRIFAERLLRVEAQNILIAPRHLMQANAQVRQKLKSIVESPRHIARMQRREPAHGLQVAQTSGRVLHIGFEMINGVLKFPAAPQRETGKLPGHSLPALMNERAKFLIENVVERRVAG